MSKPSKKRVDAVEGKLDLKDGRGFQPVVVEIDRSTTSRPCGGPGR